MTIVLQENRRRARQEPVAERLEVVLYEAPDDWTVAIEAIMDETSCTYADAESTMAWIEQLVVGSRNADHEPVYPTAEQMATRECELFELIMQHGTSSESDSAFRAIEKALLDPSLGEYSIWHDGPSDATGSPDFCEVRVITLCVS